MFTLAADSVLCSCPFFSHGSDEDESSGSDGDRARHHRCDACWHLSAQTNLTPSEQIRAAVISFREDAKSLVQFRKQHRAGVRLKKKVAASRADRDTVTVEFCLHEIFALFVFGGAQIRRAGAQQAAAAWQSAAPAPLGAWPHLRCCCVSARPAL
jgi:hypothetical protein